MTKETRSDETPVVLDLAESARRIRAYDDIVRSLEGLDRPLVSHSTKAARKVANAAVYLLSEVRRLEAERDE